jgi:hypothetical protein
MRAGPLSEPAPARMIGLSLDAPRATLATARYRPIHIGLLTRNFSQQAMGRSRLGDAGGTDGNLLR